MTERTKVTAVEIHICAMHYLNTITEAVNPAPVGFIRGVLRMFTELRWVTKCTHRIHTGRLFPLRDAPFSVVASLAQCNTGENLQIMAIKAHALEELRTRLTTFDNLLDGIIRAYHGEAER
jgi:hypothetical protein